MKGDSKEIYDVFWSTRHFIIPIYQRRYSWKISQCARLFDDIEEATEKGRKHFIGCIISTNDGNRGAYLVIDGQQRITTLSLLLKAAYDLLLDGKIASNEDQLADEILETFLKNRRGSSEQDRIKLNLLNDDSAEYYQLFDSDRRLTEDSVIHANYNYFVSRLFGSSFSLDDLYETIKSLQVVDIGLESNDNPQLIFESLNSTGLALTEGDKIRNFILMGLTSNDQVEYYREYWSRIEKNSGDNDTSGFIRDYLSLKTQKIPNMKNVYQDFRKYWMDSKKEPLEILGDLRAYSYAYEKIMNADTGVRGVDESISGLIHLETTVIRPFGIEVIHLHENGILSSDEMRKVFSIVEDYIFRRAICALPSNALNKIFATLANDIKKLDGTYENYSDKLSFVLLKKQGSGRFPGNEEFASELKNRNLYGRASRVIWYLFSRLENSGTLETKDIWNHLENEEYSIEHIMPQTLSDEWKRELGEDWKAIHETWVDRLGNLTVVASPYNSMFSNHIFIEKRDMKHGFRDSGLRINQSIAMKDKWGSIELEERANSLASIALSIWPELETSYKDTVEKDIEVSIEDDFDFTGRDLLSASFKDTELPSMDWTDFMVNIINLIYKDDPVGVASAVRNASTLGLDFYLSSSPEADFKMISDSVYLNTGCSTNRKIWFLRHLFSYLNMEEDDLVMHVTESSTSIDGEAKRRLWRVIIPYLVKATEEGGCPSYKNRNPVNSHYLDGYIGSRDMHFGSSFGFKSQSVWAYLYIEGGSLERNLEVFRFFQSHREEIEKAVGDHSIRWVSPDTKARRGEIILQASVPQIIDESRWNEVAEISGQLMKALAGALSPYIAMFISNEKMTSIKK